jgi:endonuclease-3
MIRSTGFFRNKTVSLVGMASALVERFAGEVPRTMDELNSLPGVGRKTANVILSVAFDLPGLPVDTHVTRLSKRLRLTEATDAEKIERDLCAAIPPREWGGLSLRLILHGRQICSARSPKCQLCVLGDFCPSYGLFASPVKKSATSNTRPATTARPRSKTRPATKARHAVQ